MFIREFTRSQQQQQFRCLRQFAGNSIQEVECDVPNTIKIIARIFKKNFFFFGVAYHSFLVSIGQLRSAEGESDDLLCDLRLYCIPESVRHNRTEMRIRLP